jgi:hypothetical protein
MRLRRTNSLATGIAIVFLACGLSISLIGPANVALSAPLLPDLIAWESGPPMNYMHDGSMDTSTIANKVLYRFSQPIANIGAGPLELREETDANFVQDIYQRIYDDSGGDPDEVHVGTFPNAHPPYGHMYLVGIAEYRIRTITPGNGVGPVVASYVKTSYGLYDYDKYDTSLPGAPATPHYNGSDEFLGISIGWADVYPYWFAGQYVDVTGLADGQYWLETEIDPFDLLQETNDSNNITRVMVDLVVPEPTIMPGDFNGDDVVNAADYIVWRKMLGRNVARGTSADGDGDGVVEMEDLDVWREEFGMAAPGGGSSVVPEPSTALALVSLLVCVTMRRRRAG